MNRKLVLALLACLAGGVAAAAEAERALERWRRGVVRLGLDPSRIEYPLAVTPELERVAREVAAVGTDYERLRRLQIWLFDQKGFPFDYSSRGTRTAAETLEHREGNCVSFTSLFIALGRAAGVEVGAALLVAPTLVERDDDLIVVNTHIVAVQPWSGGLRIFDFNRQTRQGMLGLQPVDDVQFTAIHLNNRGADALRAADYDTARALLETAVQLWPEFGGAWGNLGVVHRREGNVDGAYAAYRRALEIEPRDPTILTNLAALHESQGRDDEARDALLAARLRDASPHTLIVRGDLELTDGNVSQAMRLYRKARREWRDRPEPRLALARGELARGREEAALRHVERALELAPDDPAALRMKRRLSPP